LWKLILKQFDDLLVKVGVRRKTGNICRAVLLPSGCPGGWFVLLTAPSAPLPCIILQILIVAAFVDFIIALANGEKGFGAFVEPFVILVILVANGED
jgi:hypothetical protein